MTHKTPSLSLLSGLRTKVSDLDHVLILTPLQISLALSFPFSSNSCPRWYVVCIVFVASVLTGSITPDGTTRYGNGMNRSDTMQCDAMPLAFTDVRRETQERGPVKRWINQPSTFVPSSPSKPPDCTAGPPNHFHSVQPSTLILGPKVSLSNRVGSSPCSTALSVYT